MSKGQMLRDLVMERLVVAADEIFALFERTIAEYEEEALRSKLSLGTHNKGVQTLEVGQTLCIKQEEAPPLEYPLTSVSVKTEDNVEKSFLFQQEPPEESREEPGCSLYLQSDKDKQTYSCSDTENSDDWEPSAMWPTTCDGQQSKTVHRKDSKQGVQSHLVSREIRRLLQRPTEVTHEEQLREETPGSNSGAHCSTKDSDDWETAGHTLNQVHIKASERFSCSVCGKGFSHISNLKRHMAAHTNDRPFSCPECNLRFKYHHNVIQHISAVHRGEKPYNCSVCGKAFAQKGTFNVHMRTHTGERPFSCTVCNASFGVKWDLKKHLVKMHSGL